MYVLGVGCWVLGVGWCIYVCVCCVCMYPGSVLGVQYGARSDVVATPGLFVCSFVHGV